MSLLTSLREYRRFRRLSDDQRNLVFYSEGRNDWHHFEPIIDRLTREHAREVCYVSSDAGDPGLRVESQRLRAFGIEKGLARIVWFQLLRADLLVLTMMDLGNFELRRSVHPVHYVYLFHSLGSTHMVDFERSYDHYDTILCAGPHQMREIRRREQLQGLPEKRLGEHGYARLEVLMAERAARAPARSPGPPVVLIAPTWGEHSTLNVCGERLVSVLLDAGYRVILRPHYQTLQLTPEVVHRIVQRFRAHPAFEYVEGMGESESLFRSELLVSDWSAMAVEYALGLEKPVLFIDVPPRVRNPDYRELGLDPIEAAIRPEVGAVLDPGRLEDAPRAIEKLLAGREELHERAAGLRGKYVCNLGRSAEVAAAEIARIGDEMAKARRQRARAR